MKLRILKLLKNDTTILTLMIVLGGFLAFLYIGITGNIQQVYNDIIIEWTTWRGSNKSLERLGIYLLICFGIIFYTLCFFARKKFFERENNIELTEDRHNTNSDTLAVSALLIIAGVTYLIYNNSIVSFWGAVVLVTICFLVNKGEIVNNIVYSYFFVMYALIAVYRIIVCTGANFSINIVFLTILSIVAISHLLCMSNDTKRLADRLSLICQLFTPALMLVFFMNKYSYQGKIVDLKTPYAVRGFVIILMVGFVIEAALKIIEYWKQDVAYDKLIGIGSCAAIMIFNRYSGSGAIMSSDLHHPFENIISYSQIFQLGQEPYEQYIPVSGLFPLIHGFIFEIFGNGLYANYYLATNVFFSIVSLMVVWLLSKQIRKDYVLLISLIVPIIDYNRLAFVLPIMLILTLPSLIKNKVLWLQVWLVSSLFNGLYYPLYGCAVFLGFIPFAFKQYHDYIDSNKFMVDKKNVVFWFSWSLCIILALSAMPWLIGSAKHMLAMSQQSLLADGITRFGQLVPDWFMNYLPYKYLRIILYDTLTYLVPATLIWISYIIMVRTRETNNKNNSLFENERVDLLILTIVIMPIISFTYTLVRLDINTIVARSGGVIIAAMVVLIVLCLRVRIDNSIRKLAVNVAFVLLAIAGVAQINPWKLDFSYSVPQNYTFVQNDVVPRLGKGFIDKGILDSVHNYWNKYRNDANTHFSIGLFGHHYLCDIKGGSVIEACTIRGFGAAQETVDLLKREKCYVGPVDTVANYYLFRWLLTSGDYIWDSSKNRFVYTKNILPENNVLLINSEANMTGDGICLGKISGELGWSMPSLRNIFTKYEISYQLQQNTDSIDVMFEKETNGEDMDFIYIDLNIEKPQQRRVLFDLNHEEDQGHVGNSRFLMKKDYNFGKIVEIQWEDNKYEKHSLLCDLRRGKLLIPLGSGNKWLLHKHKYISIKARNWNQPLTIPLIKHIEFLKLREVK